MNKYVGLMCPVCSARFDEDDDIVVCPECGTPHHRSCYKENRSCVNLSWHDENKSFDVEAELEKAGLSKENKSIPAGKEIVVCRRCGHVNLNGEENCSKCSNPLVRGIETEQDDNESFDSKIPNAAPFPQFVFNPDEQIDGVETYKLLAVIKENQFRFINYFKTFFKGKQKISFNFCAFLFGPLYFIYRKMYKIGIPYLVLFLLLSVSSFVQFFSVENIAASLGTEAPFGIVLSASQNALLETLSYYSEIVLFVLKVAFALLANFIYYRKCIKICKTLDLKNLKKEEYVREANVIGGCNRGFIKILFIAYVVLTFAMVALLNFPSAK